MATEKRFVSAQGENINITWSPDGQTIAVGNKEDLVTFIDSRTYKVSSQNRRQMG
jgi:THO complex subunit 3